jgi:hypothetical protein
VKECHSALRRRLGEGAAVAFVHWHDQPTREEMLNAEVPNEVSKYQSKSRYGDAWPGGADERCDSSCSNDES